MLNIRKMYAEGSQGGPTSFDYANYDRVLEEIKKKKEQLAELSQRVLHSQDVSSAAFLEALDRKLTAVPQSAKPVVETLERMIKSMENVRENYKAREAEIASSLNQNF